jgi:hypothetical protein
MRTRSAWAACLCVGRPIGQVTLGLLVVCWADPSAHVALGLRQDPTILGSYNCRTQNSLGSLVVQDSK